MKTLYSGGSYNAPKPQKPETGDGNNPAWSVEDLPAPTDTRDQFMDEQCPDPEPVKTGPAEVQKTRKTDKPTPAPEPKPEPASDGPVSDMHDEPYHDTIDVDLAEKEYESAEERLIKEEAKLAKLQQLKEEYNGEITRACKRGATSGDPRDGQPGDCVSAIVRFDSRIKRNEKELKHQKIVVDVAKEERDIKWNRWKSLSDDRFR